MTLLVLCRNRVAAVTWEQSKIFRAELSFRRVVLIKSDSSNQFGNSATERPNIGSTIVLLFKQTDFGCSVPSRTNVVAHTPLFILSLLAFLNHDLHNPVFELIFIDLAIEFLLQNSVPYSFGIARTASTERAWNRPSKSEVTKSDLALLIYEDV